MKHIVFWFDPISPFAYLAFERLPQVLEGLSVEVRYQPILFAGLLKHWGQKGPAEIEPKRAWTFRHVHWLAHQQGIEMQTPVQHPFNPLALSRLMLACAPAGSTPNRLVCETVLRHVWQGGHDAADPARLAALTAALAPVHATDSDVVKNTLREATQAALERGIFGVPTVEVDGRLFWGVDGLDMLRAHLHGNPWFASGAWEEAGAARPGVQRPA